MQERKGHHAPREGRIGLGLAAAAHERLEQPRLGLKQPERELHEVVLPLADQRVTKV